MTELAVVFPGPVPRDEPPLRLQVGRTGGRARHTETLPGSLRLSRFTKKSSSRHLVPHEVPPSPRMEGQRCVAVTASI